MKKHAIIPVFIPHIGCGHSCVFCNQNVITARSKAPSAEDVKNMIEQYLPTLSGRGLDTIEVAFFGGSFTGIPLEQQNDYLDVAYAYKKQGLIDKIHMSTRPDYIDRSILDNLSRFSVDTIELGVQSFDDEVLKTCRRGHTADDVYRACELIKSYCIELGIQLMIGLPGDTKEKALRSAAEAAGIGPSLARLYPTVVLPDTRLAGMLREGSYTPLSEGEAVDITKEMYKILMNAHINIMRVGLKSTDLMTNETDLGHGYHPAFRQLVESEICREQMEQLLEEQLRKKQSIRRAGGNNGDPDMQITFFSNEKWFSPMIGHKAANKKYFSERYPEIEFAYKTDRALADGHLTAESKQQIIIE